MTALAAAAAGKHLANADALPPVILVFGPDRSRVTEVTDTIAAHWSDDPFQTVRLDAATLVQDPARLEDEARTVSLFGGRRLVLLRDGGSRNLAPALAPLLADPPTDAVVVIEAGDLRRGTGVRKELENHRTALAIYCPQDTERDLAAMIDEEAGHYALTVETDAREALIQRLGGDRGASRGEIVKACLHAAGSGRLSVADVDAVVGDIAETALAEAVDAAFLGQLQTLDRELTRLLRQDGAAVQLLMAAQRTAHTLELAAVDVAAGTTPSRAVEAVRPPIFGARKAPAVRIVDRWRPKALRQAGALVAAATFRTRIMPHLAPAIARDTLLRIAARA